MAPASSDMMRRWAGLGWAGLLLSGPVVQLAAFWPGVMVWDAIRQYRQALSGRYDDWHPPAMDWLWRELGVFGGGPAPMLVAQTLLYWTGLALLALAAARGGRPKAAWAVAACGFLPIPFLLIGTVLKDSLMAGALLLAAGLIAVRRPGDRVLGVGAAGLLLAAAALRFNAVPACLPLAMLLAPARWRAPWSRFAITAVAAGAILTAALPVANRLLRAEHSGVELSLVIYDLGGITRFSGVDAFPPVGVADPVSVNEDCYTPVSWDSYAWWGADPCPIGFEQVRTAFAVRGIGATRWWLGAIAAHPIAYAEHRLAHVDRNLRWWVHDADLPTLSLDSDPNPWGYRVAPSPLRRAIDTVATASLETPLGWPICWLAVAAACLLLRPAGLAAALAWSALLYGLSYVPLSVASEVRYHFWTMTAAALAAVLTLAARPAVARWRWQAAGGLVGATTAVAVLARLAA